MDAIYIGGDMNARIGNLEDFIPTIDSIPKRVAIDDFVNKHGETFLEFLRDSRMCLLNGRIDPLYDNYTSVSPKGKAVVDYIVVPFDCLENCLEFKVLLASQIVEDRALFNLIGDNCRLPDHSMLWLKFGTGPEMPHQQQEPVTTGHTKKWVSRDVPDTFLKSDLGRTAMLKLIEKTHNLKKNQEELDNWYKEFCVLVQSELNTNVVKPKCRKSKQNNPYWNSELGHLWSDMRSAERLFLKCKDPQLRKRLKVTYKQKQYNFDKRNRFYKRRYQRGQIIQIEQLHTQNPQQFWNEIKNLGPKRPKKIPMQVWSEGEISSDPVKVLSEWEGAFSGLFSKHEERTENISFDHISCLTETCSHSSSDDYLNRNLNREELLKAINSAKDKKAFGVDELPNEVLKAPKLFDLLFSLLNVCFEHSIIPSTWFKSIITPIPKSPKDDPKIPLNYRGISLLSTVYKLYSSVLNNRLVNFLEQNNKLEEEQNGFRKGRACLDHIYTVTTVVRNRLKLRKHTFGCFIDFQKAFDLLDHKLLKYKLHQNGVNGKFYNAISSLYRQPVACVKVNEYFTEWFATPSGVKQGDILSPTLFAIFINDLAREVKQLEKGVQCGYVSVDILLYADDIILLSENEDDLQKMLTCVNEWCKKWKMCINQKKTQVMHFRNPGTEISNFKFCVGDKQLEFADKYKYLGLFLDEHMSFLQGVTALADSAGRALGGLIGKTKILKDMGYFTYSQLYHSCVCPILDYMSGVWGYKCFQLNERVQNRAIRFFLGLHKYAPIPAFNGDMGWDSCKIRWKANMVNLWNRLLDLPPNRVASQIFYWDLSVKGVWVSEMFDLLQECGLEQQHHQRTTVNVVEFRNRIRTKCIKDWAEEIWQKPKLRTYCLFKNDYKCEKYVLYNLPKSQRSLCAQLRCGILPLHIETGALLRRSGE